MTLPNSAPQDRHPRVPIGVPVRNGARYLAEALKAIADQTFIDFEVVISDNASTDRSKKICERFVSHDKRLRHFRQSEKRGGSRKSNEVARLASGEHFKRAAHDDLIEPTFLKVRVNTLGAAPPEVIMCYARTILIDADGAAISDYENKLDIRASTSAERFRTYLWNYELGNAIFGLFRINSLPKSRLVL